jgi:hypothetical protein
MMIGIMTTVTLRTLMTKFQPFGSRTIRMKGDYPLWSVIWLRYWASLLRSLS